MTEVTRGEGPPFAEDPWMPGTVVGSSSHLQSQPVRPSSSVPSYRKPGWMWCLFPEPYRLSQRSFLAKNLLSFPGGRGPEAVYFCSISFLLFFLCEPLKTDLPFVNILLAREAMLWHWHPAGQCQLPNGKLPWCFFPLHPPPSIRLIFPRT